MIGGRKKKLNQILKAKRLLEIQTLLEINDTRTAQIVMEAKYAERLDPVYAADLRGAILSKPALRRLIACQNQN